MSLPRLPVGKALVTLLETGTGKRCGYGRLPTDPAGPVAPPYMVLQPITRTEDGSPLGTPDQQVDWQVQLWQVTSVGGDRMDQAVWMNDRSHAVLVGPTLLVVAGMSVVRRELADDAGPEEGPGGIVSLVSRYAITVTGA